ncbi:MAG: NADH-quinone oxidoreductase subunit G [Actinobacteria bacterium]|nr:NADH-quinone oxidoreductase subunit G [Actinomycetota bacterium]
MTLAPDKASGPPATVEDTVTVTIDGFDLRVPKGTLVIRAAERLGIQIPRFCDHPLLDPVGACRQCIVEVEGQRKPVASCTITVTDGMVVRTQLTSAVARQAQSGTLELLLINHPLDCPVCDKGGECPLQNQAMSNGRGESRFHDVKRTYPKPIAVSTEILLDRERCVLCARCTRFSQQIAGDPFIELFERGAAEQVCTDPSEPFRSYFSGNTVQICPVGALTSAAYRFRARPFDLQSTPSVCEHCASGCALRIDWRRGAVQRRLAGDDPAVNEEWNCDKGRFAFAYAAADDRIRTPMVRAENGDLVPASWPEALERAAEGLREARDASGVGVLTGGRLTCEDAYAYAKFARVALGTNDVDFRARPHSAEEATFLADRVAGRGVDVSYADLERASSVLLVGFEPEEESPIVFLRLRKAVRKRGLRVFTAAPLLSDGSRKLGGILLPTVPGQETAVLGALADAFTAGGPVRAAADALAAGNAVICVGERLAAVPGGLPAAAALASAVGARLAWIPRRAGERGAVDAGALPGLLPGGRLVADPDARAEVERVWGGPVPAAPGRDTAGILAAAADGGLDALLVSGVDPADLADPALAGRALERVGFVVSLELRSSEVTRHADVVLPVAPVVEKSGSFLTWEGRRRPFDATLHATGALADHRVLHALAEELGTDLGLASSAAAAAELAELAAAPATGAVGRTPQAGTPDRGRRAGAGNGEVTTSGAGATAGVGAGHAVLASWRLLIDAGSLAEGEPHLAGTAKPPRALLSAATAAEIGVAAGHPVRVATEHGAIQLPLGIAEMPDRVVWLPGNSPGSTVHRTLNAGAGAVVTISAGGDL